jgi:hypothetical protein
LLRFSVSSLSSLASDNAEDKIQWAVFKKGVQRKHLFEYKPVDKKAGKVEEPKKLKGKPQISIIVSFTSTMFSI